MAGTTEDASLEAAPCGTSRLLPFAEIALRAVLLLQCAFVVVSLLAAVDVIVEPFGPGGDRFPFSAILWRSASLTVLLYLHPLALGLWLLWLSLVASRTAGAGWLPRFLTCLIPGVNFVSPYKFMRWLWQRASGESWGRGLFIVWWLAVLVYVCALALVWGWLSVNGPGSGRDMQVWAGLGVFRDVFLLIALIASLKIVARFSAVMRGRVARDESAPQ